jgi:CMP-N,N'-diacetyllegionaminic acid synthase
MYKDHRFLAVVPARGGSKGVPRKNVRMLAGKPLIAWTIEQAFHSRYIDRVIVSSEDEEICQVAKQSGAEVPFVRPAELASDTASGVDVLCHAVENAGADYDYVVLLQPTSPLRESTDIEAAIEFCVSRAAKSVVSVTEATKSPYWMYQMKEGGELISFVENAASNRQQLPQSYALNGAVYVLEVAALLATRKVLDEQTLGYVMPAERSYDIDRETDFLICEFLKTRMELNG